MSFNAGSVERSSHTGCVTDTKKKEIFRVSITQWGGGVFS